MFIYAIPSLIAAIINLFLGFYIYYLNPKAKKNIVCSLFLFALCVTEFAEFLSRSAETDLKIALFYDMFFLIGTETAVWLYFYFALIFPKESKFTNTNAGKALIIILFLIGFGMNVNNVFREFTVNIYIQPNEFGYYSIADMDQAIEGMLYIPSVFLMMFEIFAGTLILIWRYRTEYDSNRRPILFMVAGVIIMFSIGIITDFLLPLLSIHTIGLSNIGMTVMGIIIAYAIVKHKLFSVTPDREKKETDLEQPLEIGYYYVILENDVNNPERSYEIFCNHVKSGMQGLLVTFKEPSEIRRKYNLEKTPILFFTYKKQPEKKDVNMGNEMYISPLALIENRVIIIDFLSKYKTEIIFIDSLKFLIEENTEVFDQRYAFLDNIKNFMKFILKSKTRLILSVDSSMVNTKVKTDVIKKNNLIRINNIWPILLLEYMCNKTIELLQITNPIKIQETIRNLSKKDSFFSNFSIENGQIKLGYSYNNPFSFQDTVHYLKEFSNEMGPLSNRQKQAIYSILAEYGVSRYEYDMEPGQGYLMCTSGLDMDINIYVEFIEAGYRGLFMSRNHPKKYMNLQKDIQVRSKFMWITNVGKCDYSLSPRLEHIQKEVEDFVENNNDELKIVFLNNLEYLVRYAGSFDAVQLFISNLIDIVTHRNGILVVPMKKGIFSANETAVLIQELNIIDYSKRENGQLSTEASHKE